MQNIYRLFDGTDPRVVQFTSDLDSFICERGEGIQFSNVLGAIEIIKHQLMQRQIESIK